MITPLQYWGEVIALLVVLPVASYFIGKMLVEMIREVKFESEEINAEDVESEYFDEAA